MEIIVRYLPVLRFFEFRRYFLKIAGSSADNAAILPLKKFSPKTDWVAIF